MDGDERFGRAKERAEPLGQIVQRVAVFGEDDQLAPVALGVEHLGVVLEEGRSSSHFLSVPLRRTFRANASRLFRISISASSSAMVRAAVA